MLREIAHKIKTHKRARRRLRSRLYKSVLWIMVILLGFIMAFICSTLVQAAIWTHTDWYGY